MITYKRLTMEEIIEIYNTYLVEDFPPAERKPLSRIKDLAAGGAYVSYCFYENAQLAGYAFLFQDREQKTVLLDYYAIMANQRGQGYGQKIIQVLGDIYKDYDYIILESENPADAADEEDLQTRNRRIRFYKEKCGLKDAGFKSCVFGVSYVIFLMLCKKEPTVAEARENMKSIYKDLIPEPYYSQEIQII